jgi:hypothetical protein
VNRDRLALLVTSSALLMSWLSAPATPTPEPAARPVVAPPPAASTQDPTTALAFDVEKEGDRLRARVASAPSPKRPGRDPFRFGDPAPRELPPARPVVAPPAAAADAVAAPPASPLLPLKLIGIAERDTEDGIVRSAVLSGPSDVYIVTVGDEVMGRYAVAAIGADGIELIESATGQSLTLALPS